ncbi:MAG: hypothetical protein QXS53_01220 [Candidatus Anstonellales archaeon]
MNTTKSRDVIIFEGRGAWNITKYKDRIYIDSPVQNIVQASKLALELLKKNRYVIMFPVIDSLVSTREYNYPRTFQPKDVDKKFNVWVEEVFPLELIPSKNALSIVEHHNLGKLLLSHQEEIFKGFRSIQKNNAEQDYKKFMERIGEKEGMGMKLFDTEATLFLINYTLEYLGIKDNMKQNLNIVPISVPDSNFSKETVLAFADRLTIHSNVMKTLEKFLENMFRSVLSDEEAKLFPTYSLPIMFDVDGYYNSPTRIEIRSNRLIITPYSRELGNVGKKYEYHVKSLKQIIEEKELVSFKYPVIILNYIYSILNALTVRKHISDVRSEFIDAFTRTIRDELNMHLYLSELVGNMNIDVIENLYFIEGDWGGVNVMTGGLVDRVFYELAKSLKARYVRIISMEREELEPKLESISFKHLIDVLEQIESSSDGYTIYYNINHQMEMNRGKISMVKDI